MVLVPWVTREFDHQVQLNIEITCIALKTMKPWHTPRYASLISLRCGLNIGNFKASSGILSCCNIWEPLDWMALVSILRQSIPSNTLWALWLSFLKLFGSYRKTLATPMDDFQISASHDQIVSPVSPAQAVSGRNKILAFIRMVALSAFKYNCWQGYMKPGLFCPSLCWGREREEVKQRSTPFLFACNF